MWLSILIGALSVGLAILGVYVSSKGEKKDPVPPPPVDPGDNPPIKRKPIPTDDELPLPIDWESLTCEEISQKIQEIKTLLMVSKWSDPRIYPFWVQELEIGEKLWVNKCNHPTDYPPTSA